MIEKTVNSLLIKKNQFKLYASANKTAIHLLLFSQSSSMLPNWNELDPIPEEIFGTLIPSELGYMK